MLYLLPRNCVRNNNQSHTGLSALLYFVAITPLLCIKLVSRVMEWVWKHVMLKTIVFDPQAQLFVVAVQLESAFGFRIDQKRWAYFVKRSPEDATQCSSRFALTGSLHAHSR